jgi:hypothetical protein
MINANVEVVMMKKLFVISLAMMACVSLCLANSNMQTALGGEVLGGSRPCPGCQHVDPGDSCASPIELTGTSWNGTFDLCDYCNDYDLSPCTGWASDADDMVFEFALTGGTLGEPNQVFVLVVPNTSWDVSLAVISVCGDFGPNSCVCGEDDNGPGYPEACSLNDLPNGIYYIVVSGYQGECGSFDICVTSNHSLPVELVSFEAIPGDGEVRLTWRTGSETDNDHFYLLRSTDGADYSRVSGDIPATNSPNGSSYSYVDGNLINGTMYYYKLVDVDINGAENVNDIIVTVTPTAMSSLSPTEYALHQNYPNPFNPNTTITYDVKEAGSVTLAVFDILGRHVATLVNDVQDAGGYSVEFEASQLAAGIYFYQLKVNDFTDLKKVVVLK